MPKIKQPEQEQAKPDSSAVKENGGFSFTAWGIHVAAKSEAEAKKVVEQAYGVDIDKDTPPHPDIVAAGKKSE